ncbi:MAG: UDP-N-acetylglucosamine 2-epimerase [Bacteroidetes bacterium]|nr:UDP-N-acetylglucosamine 2-epimerase [Bacteroidota bacterium]
MAKRKVCVVITARPSYSRIKTALQGIKDHPDLELQLVVAASALLDRYGSATAYIEKDGFIPVSKVFMVLEGENPTAMAKTTGIGVMELATVFYNLNPDVVVTVADRFETMATAVAASYMNIPLAHVQGGEVTGNIDEKVRHAVTKLADIHLVASESAKTRVIRMGENPAKVFNVGCPSIDLADQVLKSPAFDFDPFIKYSGVGADNIDLKKGYVVVLQHPVTTEYGSARKDIEETLYAIKDLDVPAFWFWPNVDAGADGTSNGIRTFREKEKPKHIYFFKNFEPNDFLRLIYHSSCLIGNSSVGVRESSYLGVPTVNIGSRQAGRDRGHNIIDVDYNRADIEKAIRHQMSHGLYTSDHVYGGGNAGQKIAEVLATAELTFDKKLAY